jgi:hypothetical protein
MQALQPQPTQVRSQRAPERVKADKALYNGVVYDRALDIYAEQPHAEVGERVSDRAMLLLCRCDRRRDRSGAPSC